jgi:hypothetical protein
MKRRALLISGRVYHSSPHGEKAYIQAAWPSLGYHYFCFLPFTSRGIPLSSCCLKGCRRSMKNYGLPWDCGPFFDGLVRRDFAIPISMNRVVSVWC